MDATPIEGFNNEQLDALLHLAGSGYRSTVLLPLSYCQEEGDWLMKLKKVRTPQADFISELTLADVAAPEGKQLLVASQP